MNQRGAHLHNTVIVCDSAQPLLLVDEARDRLGDELLLPPCGLLSVSKLSPWRGRCVSVAAQREESQPKALGKVQLEGEAEPGKSPLSPPGTLKRSSILKFAG